MTAPFRMLFYTKLVMPLFVALVAMAFFVPSVRVREMLLAIAVGTILLWGLSGLICALLLCFRLIRFTCPFCGRPGIPYGNRRFGLMMDCDECGHIRGGGPLSLTIVRGEIRPEDQWY